MKKKLVVSMVLLILLTVGVLLPSVVSAEKVSDKRIVLVLPGGLGDRSFIDSAHRGLVWAEERLGVETKYIEPSGPEDFEFLIRTSAMSGADLIITVYFTMLDATNTVADEFPHVQFAIIDAVSDRPNVTDLGCYE